MLGLLFQVTITGCCENVSCEAVIVIDDPTTNEIVDSAVVEFATIPTLNNGDVQGRFDGQESSYLLNPEFQGWVVPIDVCVVFPVEFTLGSVDPFWIVGVRSEERHRIYIIENDQESSEPRDFVGRSAEDSDFRVTVDAVICGNSEEVIEAPR